MSHFKPIYAKAETVSLKTHPDYDERWVRDRIVEDPALLGLGPLVVKDVERVQPRTGRLDLLLADPLGRRRYEVELMLGPVDDSHVIRTLEYWDAERKRFPHYDHCAVLVAEQITPRFVNVLGLFNSVIPIIAIQMTALLVREYLVLRFDRIVDEVRPAAPAQSGPFEDLRTPAPRPWKASGPNLAPAILDECFSILRGIDPAIEPDNRRDFVALTCGGQLSEHLTFFPQHEFLGVKARTARKEVWLERLEAAGLVVLSGGPLRRRIHFRLTLDQTRLHRALLAELFAECLAGGGNNPEEAL